MHAADKTLHQSQLLAKCETRQSLFNFASIVAAADGVIISRGNLGLDVLPEKMALTQKHMVSICNIAGKPCYITRVVDTMIRTPRPTRCAVVVNLHCPCTSSTPIASPAQCGGDRHCQCRA